MPRMPDMNDLPTAQGISPGVPRQMRDFIGPAIENLGNAITGAGDRMDAQAKVSRSQEDALDLARARAAWTKGRMELDATYDTGTKPDYGKWGEDYQANIAKVREQSSALIKNPTLRERFMIETDPDVTSGTMAITGRAKDLDRGVKLEEAQQGIDAMAGEYAGATTQDERNRITVKAWATIDNLEKTGVIDPAQAMKVKQGFGKRAQKLQAAYDLEIDPKGTLDKLKGRNIPIVTANQEGRVSKGSIEGVDQGLLKKFSLTQNQFGKAVPIVSGVRDAATNAKAGGAKHSQHLDGKAIDLDVSNLSKDERRRLIELASANGITGIGVYNNSLHFDLGARRAWGPSKHRPSVPAWAESAILRHETGTVRGVSGHQVRTGGDLWARLIHQESGGNQSAVSPKGAVGVAQIMPETAPEAAKLAGLPWDETKYRTDAKYNEALGKAYLAEKLREFNGDEAKALAAYNAGAGRVREAIAKAGDNWLSVMPAETQAYVPAILGEGGGSFDAYPLLDPEDRLTMIKSAESMVEAQDTAERESMAQMFADEAVKLGDAKSAYAALATIPDADIRKKAEGLADAQLRRNKEVSEQETSAAYAKSYDGVIANLNDPKAAVAAIDPGLPAEKRETLRKLALDGPPRKDDYATETNLTGMWVRDPAGFAGTDLTAYLDRLTPATIVKMRGWQNDYQKDKAGNPDKIYSEKRAAVNSAADIVRRGLDQIGVVTGAKATPQDAKIEAQIMSMAGRRVEALTEKLKRQPLESEIDVELKDMWKTVAVTRPGWLWGTNVEDFQIDDVLKVYDDAGYDADEAQRALATNGFEPTVENLLKYKDALDQMKAAK